MTEETQTDDLYISKEEKKSRFDDENKLNDQEIIERDELLLNLTMHYYDETVQRNELLDSKSNQMIIFAGVMLTLQVTLFTDFLVKEMLTNPNIIWIFKIEVCLLFLLNVLAYITTMWTFIKSYSLKDFGVVPKPCYVIDHFIREEYTSRYIQAEMISDFDKANEVNCKTIDEKVNIIKNGFEFLKCSIVLNFYFLAVTFFIILIDMI